MFSWLVVYVLVVMGAALPMLINGPSDFRNYVENRSNLIYVAYFMVHVPYLVAGLRNTTVLVRGLLRLAMPAILIFYATTSVVYSEETTKGLVLALLLIAQISAAVMIFSTVSFETFFQAIVTACAVALVASFAAIFLVPAYGTMTYEFPGAWQGIFIHKNTLGWFGTLCLATFLAYPTPERGGAWRWVGLGGAVALIAGCGSASAAVTAIAVVICFFLVKYRWARAVAAVATVLVLIAVFGSGVRLNLWESFFVALDRSETLSGRTTIWQMVLSAIAERPWFGYGIGGFWNTETASIIREEAGWHVPNAHNGLLEVGLQLGYVGVALLVIQLILALESVRRNITKEAPHLRLWSLLVLVQTAMHSINEVMFLRPAFITEIIIYGILFYLASGEFARQRRDASGRQQSRAVARYNTTTRLYSSK